MLTELVGYLRIACGVLVGYLFLAALSNHQSAGYANRLALIVRVNQFSGFIQSDFSFDVSLCHIYEIRRWLQPIYSLQSDSRLPVLGAFLLRRLSLSKILIEGCELVDIIFIHRCNA